jgi:ubiquinone/menaquinone biosynthesis C-methylase UbiE
MLERIRKFLEKRAPEGIPFPVTRLYSLLAESRFMKGFYRQVASEVAVELRQGRILDVGTGPGYLPIEIARSIPGVEVVGIDVSSDMVEMARKNAERAGLSGRVRFMVEDANYMSFESSYFDLIVSTGSLHHWRDPLRVINEVHRVLKGGGQAWIYELHRDAPEGVVVKKLEEYGYGKVVGLIVYKAVKLHASVTLREVLKVLEDGGNRFKRYSIEENWRSYPVLKVRLLKG